MSRIVSGNIRIQFNACPWCNVMCPLCHSHNWNFSNDTGFCLVGGVCWVCTGNLCSFALFLVPMWVAIFTAHHPWLFILDSLQDTSCMRTTHILWRHCVYLVLLSVKCFLNRFICSHFVFIYKNLIPVARKVDDHECKFCAMSSSNITCIWGFVGFLMDIKCDVILNI